jgi:predicted lipoprotein with Yx(FWY)xxD motif
MQRPKIIIASLAVAAIAAVGGTTAALASGSSPSSAAPTSSAPATNAGSAGGMGGSAPAGSAVVRTAQATVNGKTETILVNTQGLPLYYYQPDTATQSSVTGQLAVAWPPLTSSAPTAAGVSGKLTAVTDAHGSQVAYNGHLLYTFVSDSPGNVTGQGVQNFFVVTPGIAPLAGTSAGTTAPAASAPASPATGGYGY